MILKHQIIIQTSVQLRLLVGGILVKAGKLLDQFAFVRREIFFC